MCFGGGLYATFNFQRAPRIVIRTEIQHHSSTVPLMTLLLWLYTTHPDTSQISTCVVWLLCVFFFCVCNCVYVLSTGQVTGLQRGPTTEKWEYDSQGRIISRVFADGKTWSYTYLDKVQILAKITNKLLDCLSDKGGVCIILWSSLWQWKAPSVFCIFHERRDRKTLRCICISSVKWCMHTWVYRNTHTLTQMSSQRATVLEIPLWSAENHTTHGVFHKHKPR